MKNESNSNNLNKKTLSPKQQLWIVRNRILWRLKGMTLPLITPGTLTPEEIVTLEAAFRYIKQVCTNSTVASRELGFNAKPRCKYCGKPLTEVGKCKCTK